MAKSPDAFRTISEVADWLGVQAHVLRFWESKFAQVKPIKRAGGRRYYRPSDMLLLGGLKKILHEDGLTIKGAQKMLREKGVSYVADLSQPLDDLTIAVIEGSSTPVEAEAPQEVPDMPVASAGAKDLPERAADEIPEPEPLDAQTDAGDDAADRPDLPLNDTAEPEPAQTDALPSFRARPRDGAPADEPAPQAQPSRKETEEVAARTEAPKPRRIEVTLVHDHTLIEAAPSALSQISGISQLSAEQAREIRPLLARLTRLRASMANPRKEIRKD